MTVRRIVALGASNLTRGLQTVLRAAAHQWGPGLELVAALGHGRSYGSPSRVLLRELPSIVDCGLWARLAADDGDARPTRALVTDVGNDILYGADTARILDWVGACVARLRGLGADTIVTGLPLDSLARLGRGRFTAFRSVLVPSCRLSLPEVRERAHALHEGLRTLAREHGARFAELPGEWYGFDPIHVRPTLWAHAWQRILLPDAVDGTEPPRLDPVEWLRLYAARPDRWSLAGRELRTPQPSARVAGIEVSLY